MFGLGRQKPHHYREMLKIVWENRDELPFAWRILNDGVCDGCALGTSGLSDWTSAGPHLCMVRLELMRLNTAPALDPSQLADCSSQSSRTSEELRALGRLPDPMLRRQGERGFRVLSWDDAYERIAAELRAVDPARAAFYLTSRGITNEVYYAAQKAARFLGTNHVDNSARLCHAASTAGMKATLGYGASTCSYVDWLRADLIVLFGSNVANNQPVTTKYLHQAKENGAQIAVVNPYREPGLERYWVPSIPSSAVFGTALADHWFDVHTGGDLAFLIGVFRALVEAGGVDEGFVRDRTEGFAGARDRALAADWKTLECDSGATRERMRAFARLLIDRPNTVIVWSMGLTQHTHGVDTIKALMNVGLARGLPGRPNRGLVPIRGHSGVQGGAEVGCVPKLDAATTARCAEVWGFPFPSPPGWTTSEMIDHAAEGAVDLFWIVGGNFLETLPDADRCRRALQRPRLRIHQDIVLSSSMLVDGDGDVLVLPATTRYESAGGGTETSTERRIIFSPEIPGRRIGSARPEWQVFGEAMARAFPDRAGQIHFDSAAAIRAEIARAVPLYVGIERLRSKGDQVQWGGRTLYADGRFATPDGKAHFSLVAPRAGAAAQAEIAEKKDLSAGSAISAVSFRVSTRRGKQFNSMIQREVDPLTGARRDDVLIAADDLRLLGLESGAAVVLRSASGSFHGRLKAAPIKAGNLEVHWPEGNTLLSASAIDPDSMEPDYNATVTLARETKGTKGTKETAESNGGNGGRVVALVCVLCFLCVLGCLGALGAAARAAAPPSIDAAFQRFWAARNPPDAGKAAQDIVRSGVTFDDALGRLKRGRPYTAQVKRGAVQLERRSVSGGFFYQLVVPETYDPARTYQLRVQLHGGVMMRETSEPRGRGGRGGGPLEGAEQIYLLPTAWRDAPWWGRAQLENLDAILDSVKRTYNVDENRVVLSGVSDGATGLYYVAMRDTTPYASFLPLNGFLMVLANDQLSIDTELFPTNLLNKPLFIVNGGQDPLYPIRTVQPFVDHLKDSGVAVEYHPRPEAGHNTAWWPEIKEPFEAFVHSHPRDPLPAKITWEATDHDLPSRAHWLVIDRLRGAGATEAPMQPDLNLFSGSGFNHGKELFRRGRPSGRVDLVRHGNAVEMTTRGVAELTLLLSPDVFDFSQPIVVTANGRIVSDRRVEPSMTTLLKCAARDNDRTMLFGAELPLAMK
jgi:molybdopterin-dependent oxidoreductase alpha subunit